MDSVIISLIRSGKGISPDYSLTIYGYGKVLFEGKENVKTIGEVKEKIEDNKISMLLAEFKIIDFFSLNDTYPVDNSEDRPYTTVSISITDENDKVIEKKVIHYHGDKKVPRKLIDLEDKIDDIVGTDKWIKGKKEKRITIDSSEIIGEKHIKDLLEKHERKSKIQKKTKSYKKAIISTILLFVIIALIFFMMQQFVDDSIISDDEINDNNSNFTLMSAKEYIADKNESEVGLNITRYFMSLDDGDNLVIEDTIDFISYRYDDNKTNVRFDVDMTGGYTGSSYVSFSFKGKLNESFNEGGLVRISVKIKHVTYSLSGYNIDEELFEEQWPLDDGGKYKYLPQSCIELV